MIQFNSLYNTPESQRFWTPTRIFSGSGCRHLLLDILAPGRPAVLVVDTHFAEHPFVEKLMHHSGGRLCQVVVQGEPTYAAVEAGLECIDGRAWDQLVALGGGSTLDIAKALLAQRTFGSYRRIGYGEKRELPDWWPVESNCPFIAIPTTSGTGSETSRYYLLSDPASGQKTVSRAWTLCPTTALLDPFFIANMPESLRVMGAFDAFTHLWETYFCAQERSLIVQTLAQQGIALILKHMLALEGNGCLDQEGLKALQTASAWGGIALSNVRTGLLHTAGEALAAQLPLPHPLTLWFFFKSNMDVFHNSYRQQGQDLFNRLAPVIGCGPGEVLDTVEAVWQRAFLRSGCEKRLRETLNNGLPQADLLARQVGEDHVLLFKEAPKPLNHAQVDDFLRDSIQYWKVSDHDDTPMLPARSRRRG